MPRKPTTQSKKKKPAAKSQVGSGAYPATSLTKAQMAQMAKQEAQMAQMAKQEAQMAKQEARWRAESDLRTLQEAESIKGDPGRMRMMKTLADEQMRALQKIKKN